MLRKYSARGRLQQGNLRPAQGQKISNDYHLPHPPNNPIKTPNKHIQLETSKSKLHLKNHRKISTQPHVSPNSVLPSKQGLLYSNHKQVTTKKIQIKKHRCLSNTNSQTPRRSFSKGNIRLQLNGLKPEIPSHRLNIKIEQSSKVVQANQAVDSNYDSYYNNQCFVGESKTMRSVARRQKHNQDVSGSTKQLSSLLTKCQKIMQNYQQELEICKRQNLFLKEQNKRLKKQNEHVKK